MMIITNINDNKIDSNQLIFVFLNEKKMLQDKFQYNDDDDLKILSSKKDYHFMMIMMVMVTHFAYYLHIINR